MPTSAARMRFSYTGSDAAGLPGCGRQFPGRWNGHITSGTQDINSGFAISTNAAITGTYTGPRRRARFGHPELTAGNSTIDFVIVSGGHALVTRFDANAAGSGTMDLQTTSAFSNAALAGSFAFSLAGIDTGGAPLAVAGNFTSDASGNLTAGIDDSNDNGGVITNDPMTGSIPVSSHAAAARPPSIPSRGTLNFAFYVVDANHLESSGNKLIPGSGGEAFPPDRPVLQRVALRALRFHRRRGRFAFNGPVCRGRSFDFERRRQHQRRH